MAGEPYLKFGDSGEWVVELHRLMDKAGWVYYPDPNDQFGEETAKCVMQFQDRDSFGDGVDRGHVGTRVWEHLQSYDL